MKQPDPTSRRPALWTAFATTAIAGASAVSIVLPASIATADPVPPPAPTTSAAPASPAPASAAPASPAPPADPAAPPPPPADPAAPPPPPADPAAPPPPPADPAAPPPPPADPAAPPADPAAPAADPGRVENGAGGFSYLPPAGWEVADPSRLSYGQALLLKQTGPAVMGQPAPTANDTSILLGRLDLKLFAGAEADNGKAAVRLASDMGEFFMPFPGTRINQQSSALPAGGLPGYSASYDVKFTDTSKPNGQIWVGVVGTPAPTASRGQAGDRWFVVYLGTAKNPIDTAAAAALAQSITPYTPPPPPAPPPPDPNAPPPEPGNRVGVPIPVETPVPEMMPGA